MDMNLSKSLLQRWSGTTKKVPIARIDMERFNTSLGIVGAFLLGLLAYLNYEAPTIALAETMDLWLASQLVLGTLWVFYTSFFNRFQPWARKAWPYLTALTSTTVGLIWGLGWIEFVSQTNFVFDLIFSILFLSIIAGGVFATVFHKPSMFLLVFSVLILPLHHSLTHPTPLSDFFSILFSGGMVAFGVFGLIFNRLIEHREINVSLVRAIETERQQAVEANQEKTRFLAAASHDLRQPIQAIRMFEYVLSSQITDQGQLDILKKLESSTESLASLLDSLLDMSRLDAGIIEVEHTTIDLNEMFASLHSQYVSMALENKIAFNYRPTDKHVYSDPKQLERMLRNLIQNAIKHMERPGKILLASRRDGDDLKIMVLDNGFGIEEGEQKRIFDEFYQVNNPERNRAKGLGLGLSIVKRLGLLLNHPISMTSKPGKGCCFSIVVPLDNSPK